MIVAVAVHARARLPPSPIIISPVTILQNRAPRIKTIPATFTGTGLTTALSILGTCTIIGSP